MNFQLTSFLIGILLGGGGIAVILWPFIHPRTGDEICPDQRFVLMDPETATKQFAEELEQVVSAVSAPAKYALVVDREQLPPGIQYAVTPDLYAIPPNFYQMPTRLVDRAVCETDENTLQLLPYVLIWNPQRQFLAYRRGGGGAEGRLHGKLSIGWGGHVDTAPMTLGDKEARPLRRHLFEEAARELMEETGAKVGPEDFAVLGLIADPTNPVGRVHLGILMAVGIESDAIGIAEEGSIDDRRWMTISELEAAGGEMEVWSQVALDTIVLRRGGY